MENTDFIQQAIEKAGEAVRFAVERNIPLIIRDIERATSQEDADPDADTLGITVKLAVVHPRPQYISFTVASVEWTQKRKYADKDFPVEEVDMLQPELPGMKESIRRETPKEKEPSNAVIGEELPVKNTERQREIERKAQENDCDIYMPNIWKSSSYYRKGIAKYDHIKREWKTFYCDGKIQPTLNALDGRDRDIVFDQYCMLTLNTMKRIAYEQKDISIGMDSDGL